MNLLRTYLVEKYFEPRMHSSRMRPARFSGHLSMQWARGVHPTRQTPPGKTPWQNPLPTRDGH